VNHRLFAPIAVAAIAILAVIAAITEVNIEAARVVVGMLLALVLPGYAITVAVFPQHMRGGAERVTFSLGLSLVVAFLGGLVLNWTPQGLQATSWAVLLGSVTLAASIVAVARLWSGNREQSTINRVNPKISIGQGALLVLAALVTCAAIGIARNGAATQSYPGFTQLWMLPADGDSNSAVRVGVRSGEPTAVRYRLQVEADGYVVLDQSPIDLEPEEDWETVLAMPSEYSQAETVDAVLYRLDAPEEPYRRVTLWIGTGEG